MGLFDSLFGNKSPSQEAAKLPPIHGGDGSSPHTPVIINCAAMSMANHLIDRFISERHGQPDVDWERGIEFFVKADGIQEFTVRAIGVKTKAGSGPTYYFNIARPMSATKNLTSMMGIPEPTLDDTSNEDPSTVVAHIIDPKSGYVKQQWTVGKHVEKETVRRLGDNGNVFVVVGYEAGNAKHVICKREIWNQVKAQFNGIDKVGSESMRRIMDELNKHA